MKIKIETVYDMNDFVKKNLSSAKPFIAVLPDSEKIPMSRQYYVENSIFYMLLNAEKDRNVLTARSLKDTLDHEATDSCWDSGLDGSSFGDCYVSFVPADDFEGYKDESIPTYSIADIIETATNFELIMEEEI